jgi:phospholipase C
MGGWIASETFDHTSTLQFLERLTGVRIPNITPWRRQTFGDLSSAFGGFTPGARFPRLPDTKAALARAVYEVNNLPAPVVPTTDQVLPVQATGPRPRPRP